MKTPGAASPGSIFMVLCTRPLYMETRFFILRCAHAASTRSLLYTRMYMTVPSPRAVATSKTECCLMNTVDNMMARARMPEAIRMPFFSRSALQRMTAK